MKPLIVTFALSLFLSLNANSATQCRVLINSEENVQSLSERQITELIDKSKSYQDKRNKEWAERNKCLCCHTSLPYMLGRGLDANSKANFDKFKETAAIKVENPEARPWYHADQAGRNSKPTEAVLNALTLVMHDISTRSSLNPTTLKAISRIFETMDADGRIHWLDFNLHPFESKKGELWGNSMAILTIELAKKHSSYEPPVPRYNNLKDFVIGNVGQLRPQEMSVLLWANSQSSRSKVLTSELSHFFVNKIIESQNANGSWDQKTVLGYGKKEENTYATAISLIGLIKGGYGNHPSAHKAAKWIADHQETGNFLQMGDGSVLWPATSMNRTNSMRNDRFASDIATSYSALALGMYKTEVLDTRQQN